ncbi:MAG: response regulator, partial [Deltaproteobacteria bacterium]|nr:response regulator [Deltaproteobacteria bacterium]
RLRQILTNLAGNALKFTDQGEVVLECEVIEEASTFNSIKMSIRDTGIGIAEEHQKDLFNSFTQVDETNTRKYGGTGLGLAISKQLVELLGGEIGVHSGRDKGSTFWFTMPFRIATQEAAPQPKLDLDKLKNQGILFVDDNPTMLQILTEHAESWGMVPYIAHSGIEALPHLQEQVDGKPKIQVALIDVFIPGMDGLELTRRIRELENHRFTPIVMATAFPKRGDAERALKAGISAYLPKPLRENELRECLLQVLTENRVRDLPENLVTRHSMADQATSQSGLIKVLVAEDNIVNQEVTREMLIELGFDVLVVENGQEAVDAFKQGGFSAILMDCQMPVMTGQEATMAIRQIEHDAQQSPTPILALTANVMAEDKRNALESGMDDFLVKPINPDKLEEALKKWLSKTDTVIGPTTTAIKSEVLTSDVRRSERVIELFLKDLNDRIPAIDSAISAGDANNLLQLAHGLKGSSLQIGAPGLAALARDLESVGSLTRLESAREVLDQLNSEVQRVRQALESTVQT